MHNSKIKRISLAVCLAVMPFTADAAGLGRLTVFSGLGEPLNAEIEISAAKEELSSLSARIAPAETYAEQGLERSAALGGIRLEIGKQANGTPVLKLSSTQPVSDPFLDMLIQMEWSTGRLLREYTALLDPPGYGDQQAATAAAPTVATQPPGAAAAPVTKAAATKMGKRHKAAAPVAEKPESAQSEPSAATEGYTTRSGDTLRGIAKTTQVEGVSLEQMLVGLFRANKDAFIDGNMNRLKVGKILRTPSNDDLLAVSQQEAVKEIRVQTSDWNAYRSKLAGAVAESKPAEEEARGQAVSGKITSAAEEKAAPTPTGPRDVVKLSKGEAAAAKAGAPETKAEQQARLEEATAREKAAKEADERIAALEKQTQEMKKLLELKNQALAEMQKAAATPPAAPAAAAQPTPAAQPVAPVAQPVPAQPAPVEAKPTAAPVAVAPQAEVPQPPKPKKPRTKPVVAPESTPAPSLLEDPMMLGGIGVGLIALLSGLWLYLRDKRRKGLYSFEKGILTTSGLKPNTVFGSTAGGVVDTGDTSFLTDLSHGTSGMIDTSDVDPIAEAEVYMAYGRDVQAEEILKDAIGKDPKRYELHQKLLEIYSNRKDTTAFETLAGELYATLGANDPTWQRFAAMGRALEPSNPLYAASEGGVEPVTQVPPAAQLAAAATVAAAVEPAFGEEPFAATVLEQPTEVQGEAISAEAPHDFSLDFDLDLTSAGGGEAMAETKTEVLPVTEVGGVSGGFGASEEAAEEKGLDFAFELPEPAAAENIQLEAAEIGLGPVIESQESAIAEPTPKIAEPLVMEEISFELPELGPEVSPAPEVASVEQAAPTGIAPEMLAPAETEVETVPEAEEIPDFEFELPAAVAAESPVAAIETAGVTAADATSVEEVVFDTVPAEVPDLDFNFNVDFDADKGEAEEKPAATTTVLPELDLSSISLEMEESPAAQEIMPVAPEPSAAVSGEEVVEEITLAGEESADVDTKLDLVTAYVDMGDTEGARELLDEVLKEGGPQQRERAQAILNSLG